MLTSNQGLIDERLQPSGDEAGTAPGDRKFRPDVQGLRAIAILLALLYHAGIPGFSGGYVGIEVFFVISGFVITGLLLRERQSTGGTSLRNFYGRRARRILPAATLVLIIAVIASYVLVGPLTGNQTAGDARWASFFLVNVHFAATGTNYLSSTTPPSVIENYWSLAVEEQFYIVYPAIIVLTGLLARKRSFRVKLGVVLGVVIVASYAYSIIFTSVNAQSAYFSLLVRSWELALGGLVAVCSTQFQRIPEAWAAVASWVGLAVILIMSVTLTANTVYPGALVAIPTLAAGVVIAAGSAAPEWGVERLLRCRPFPFLALISYSLYLWHWPILVIAAERRGVSSLPVWDNVLLLLVAGVIATVTYKFYENPIRHWKNLIRRRWASLTLGVVLIASSLTVATIGLHEHPSSALATPGLANLKMADPCPAPSPQELNVLLGLGPRPSHRIVARVMLVGDSTACTMLPGLEALAAPAGVRIENAAVIGCGVVSDEVAPFHPQGLEENVNARSVLCHRRASAAEVRAARSGRPDVILWSSSWERSALVVGNGPHQRIVEPGTSQWYSVLTQRMTERVQQLTSRGATVVLLTQAPFVHLGKVTGPTRSDEGFLRLNEFLRSFAAHTPHVQILDLSSYECPSGPPCPLVVDSVWVRGDGEHYTNEGALWVARWITPQLGISALHDAQNALPVMTLVGTSDGQTIRGSRFIAATAPFHVTIARVEISATSATGTRTVLGSAVYSSYLNGWLYDWNTRTMPNGTYVVHCIAYNAAGDRSISKGVTVKVAN